MKKAFLDIPLLTIIVVIIGLLILAPVMLKVFSSIQTPLASSLGNITGGGGVIAAENVNHVLTTATNFWDKVVIAAFVFAVLLMLLSSFFIDTSPVWIIIYIFVTFMVILFAPNIVSAIDGIYTSTAFTTEVASLTFMDALRTHFVEFLVGVFVLSGIIMYGKIRLFGSSGGRK